MISIHCYAQPRRWHEDAISVKGRISLRISYRNVKTEWNLLELALADNKKKIYCTKICILPQTRRYCDFYRSNFWCAQNLRYSPLGRGMQFMYTHDEQFYVRSFKSCSNAFLLKLTPLSLHMYILCNLSNVTYSRYSPNLFWYPALCGAWKEIEVHNAQKYTARSIATEIRFISRETSLEWRSCRYNIR